MQEQKGYPVDIKLSRETFRAVVDETARLESEASINGKSGTYYIYYDLDTNSFIASENEYNNLPYVFIVKMPYSKWVYQTVGTIAWEPVSSFTDSDLEEIAEANNYANVNSLLENTIKDALPEGTIIPTSLLDNDTIDFYYYDLYHHYHFRDFNYQYKNFSTKDGSYNFIWVA